MDGLGLEECSEDRPLLMSAAVRRAVSWGWACSRRAEGGLVYFRRMSWGAGVGSVGWIARKRMAWLRRWRVGEKVSSRAAYSAGLLEGKH